MSQYDVIVGNIGSVHRGTNKQEATNGFREYVSQSKAGVGRAGGEDVRAAEFPRIAEAFVDGRLRKRKRCGTNEYRVEVKPVPPTPNPDGSFTLQVGLDPLPGVPALVPFDGHAMLDPLC